MKENWGLYNSSFEHDACGIGAVVNIKGKKSNKVINDALDILENPTQKEIEILSAFKYKENSAVLHNDNNILYPNKKMYAAWNYTSTNSKNNGR